MLSVCEAILFKASASLLALTHCSCIVVSSMRGRLSPAIQCAAQAGGCSSTASPLSLWLPFTSSSAKMTQACAARALTGVDVTRSSALRPWHAASSGIPGNPLTRTCHASAKATPMASLLKSNPSRRVSFGPFATCSSTGRHPLQEALVAPAFSLRLLLSHASWYQMRCETCTLGSNGCTCSQLEADLLTCFMVSDEAQAHNSFG